MARSQMRHNVKDTGGNVIQNALCYVYLQGTTTAVSDMHAASTGGAAITTLTSNAQGDIEAWFDTAKVVDVKVTDNTNAAYRPSALGDLLSWSEFTETVSIADQSAAYRSQADGSGSGGVNLIGGDASNTIAADLGTNVIAGGGSPGFPNRIGTTLGTGAGVATISGGYDNTVNALAGTIGGGGHHVISTGATHGTIPGGSTNTITAGNYVTIGGGYLNTASGERATVVGGEGNTGSGAYSVSGGLSNTASGAKAVALGESNLASGAGAAALGVSNTASGVQARAFGTSNTASGSYSAASGLRSKASLYGQHAQASGFFAAVGDAQTSVLTLRRQTTGNNTYALPLDGGSTEVVIPDNTAWAFCALIVGYKTDRTNAGAYEVRGLIKRGAGAATTAIVGAVTVTTIAEDDAAWGASANAKTSTGALEIQVITGSVITIDWVARLELVEVTP